MTTRRALRVTSDGVNLHVVTLGDPSRVPVVLVHGYPDNHRVWDGVATRLAEQYFVVRYDVRGAGESDAPRHTAEYALELLARDLRAVVDAVLPPDTRFHLVGHDWGSIQSWESVTRTPPNARIASFTTISGPSLDHAVLWAKARASSDSARSKLSLARQLASSLYIAFFHVPFLPAAAWRLVVGRRWSRYLERQEGVTEHAPSRTQIQDGVQGVELYRANFRAKLRGAEPRQASCPVQLIVPLRDRFVRPQLLEDLPNYVPDLYRRELDATHWVVLSHPQTIAGWIAEFIDCVEANRMSPALIKARWRREAGPETPDA